MRNVLVSISPRNCLFHKLCLHSDLIQYVQLYSPSSQWQQRLTNSYQVITYHIKAGNTGVLNTPKCSKTQLSYNTERCGQEYSLQADSVV